MLRRSGRFVVCTLGWVMVYGSGGLGTDSTSHCCRVLRSWIFKIFKTSCPQVLGQKGPLRGRDRDWRGKHLPMGLAAQTSARFGRHLASHRIAWQSGNTQRIGEVVGSLDRNTTIGFYFDIANQQVPPWSIVESLFWSPS